MFTIVIPCRDGEPGARLDEAGVALRDGDREAGADRRPLPRSQLDALARGEVEAGVARVRLAGQDGVVAQAADRELDHVPPEVARSGSEAATR